VRNPAGQVTRFHYEPAGQDPPRRLTRELSDGSRVTVDLDAQGQRTAMQDAAGRVRYASDAPFSLSVTRDGLPAVTFDHDVYQRPTAIRVGSDFALRTTYDFLGRPARIDTPAGPVTYAYRPGDGTVTRTLPNGIQTRWHHGVDGRLLSITHARPPGGQVIVKYTYTYRPDDLILAIEETSPRGTRMVRFEYDPERRLVAYADSQLGTTNYRYDALGNRVAVSRHGEPSVASSFDWAGRLTRHNGAACGHDAAGNLTEYTGVVGTVKLAYTPDGHLGAVDTEQGQVTYQYDGDGNLVGRSDGGETTTYLPDPLATTWSPLAALHPDGTKTYFLWDGPTLLGTMTGGEATFFLGDHLGSVRCVTDRAGHVTEEPGKRRRPAASCPVSAGCSTTRGAST
jgi:YD repeat-containing protein